MFVKRFWIISLFVLSVFNNDLLYAQDDVDGAGDHPMIERAAGSYIFTFQTSEYERFSFPTSPASSNGFESVETMEGEYFEYTYRFEDDDVSTMRVKASYLQSLENNGFEILFKGSGSELGYRGGVGLLIQGDFNRPNRRCCNAGRNSDIRYLAAKSADGNVLMSMVTFRAQLGMGTVALVDIIASDIMDTSMDHSPLTSDEMGSGLEQHGRVAIQNILFEIDSDAILPESAEALETIAELMKRQPDLSLLVVGHTDNTGSFDYNLTLSMNRASSVADYLHHELGISEDRLQAAGAGMMAPITTNRTEEGRALNRRVELVEMHH